MEDHTSYRLLISRLELDRGPHATIPDFDSSVEAGEFCVRLVENPTPASYVRVKYTSSKVLASEGLVYFATS